MASRIPRRTFAAPFVVTLAALPGCGGRSPDPVPPSPEPIAPASQPAPIAEPTAGGTETASTEPTAAPGTPAPPATGSPATPPIHSNPPPPRPQPDVAPAEYEQRWYVTKPGRECSAMPKISCPEPKPGEPRMTCNPPPPIKYACPPNVEAPFEIVLRKGATECFVMPPPMQCPKNATCNPPPPRRVACPKR